MSEVIPNGRVNDPTKQVPVPVTSFNQGRVVGVVSQVNVEKAGKYINKDGEPYELKEDRCTVFLQLEASRLQVRIDPDVARKLSPGDVIDVTYRLNNGQYGNFWLSIDAVKRSARTKPPEVAIRKTTFVDAL